LKTNRSIPSPPRGIALMLVMVVIFALSVIVAAFAYSMSVEMRLAQVSDYDVELDWLGRSGIELAKFALAVKCPDQKDIDALNQVWAGGTSPCSNDVPQFSLKDFPLGNGKITVTITDMERKFNINMVANPLGAQMEVLQKAIAATGVTDPTQAGTIIDSILDWKNPVADGHINGAKEDYYSHLEPPYHCENGPIEDISELLLIKGVTPDVYWGINSTNHPPAAYQQQGFNHTPHSTKSRFANEAKNDTNTAGLVELFSPFGARLNINTASAKTLQLLPGIDANTAQRIIEQRAGPDGIDGTDDDVPFHSIAEVNSGLPGGGMMPPGGPIPGPVPVPAPVPGGGPAGGQPPGVGPVGVPGTPVVGLASGGLALFCDVRSYAFEVHVDAEINGVKRSYIGVVSRGGQSASQIQCIHFHAED
jgi:general secretion pathway protein K